MSANVEHKNCAQGKKKKLVKVLSSNLKTTIQPTVFKEENVQKISSAFGRGIEKKTCDNFKDNDVEASRFPFPHCVINNFLWDGKAQSPANDFVVNLREYLFSLKFHDKSNDLYKFQQTDELMAFASQSGISDDSSSNPLLQQFCSLLKTSLLPWLRKITGISLNENINMFCGKYASTDCLMCHDDELEHRRIAYVYYLTPDWKKEDGGSLDLFDLTTVHRDSLSFYDPNVIVKSILPAENSLVFFEVSSKSFHRVAEVLSSNKVRLSLTGWFHGPVLARPTRPPDLKPPLQKYIASIEPVLSDWINPTYLSFETQGAIQQQFSEDSEILLKDFLTESKFLAVLKALKRLECEPCKWKKCGPASQKVYQSLTVHNSPLNTALDENQNTSSANISADIENALALVHKVLNAFLSEEMFIFLSNLSGLSFHPMVVESDSDEEKNVEVPEKKRKTSTEPGCRFEIRKWVHGNHTLLRDTDSEKREFALDLNLFFCEKEWREEYGGYTSYIASNEAEELLTIVPSRNCLAITYRDSEAMRFVKHINHKAPETFFDVAISYYQ